MSQSFVGRHTVVVAAARDCVLVNSMVRVPSWGLAHSFSRPEGELPDLLLPFHLTVGARSVRNWGLTDTGLRVGSLEMKGELEKGSSPMSINTVPRTTTTSASSQGVLLPLSRVFNSYIL